MPLKIVQWFLCVKEGNACDVRPLLALSLVLPLYMSEEELTGK